MVDLGTGDGRFVLAAAAADPNTLVIGVDASAGAMIEASRRAAGPARRGGLPNALFVVAAAEALPHELDGVAEVVTIHLPWGSLLRGALAIDEAVAAGIAGLVAPGGRVEILLAPATRDQLDDAIDVGERIANGLADDWRPFGLGLREAGRASDQDIVGARSTWARRLGLRAGDPARAAFRLVLER
ncbi:MAG TPA: class I SAM-dependent methyltransferase [Candidatus Limnocylindrales bacterium]